MTSGQPNIRNAIDVSNAANANIFSTTNGKGKSNSPRGTVGQSIVGNLINTKDIPNRAGSVEGQVAPGAPGGPGAESTSN